MRRTVTFGRVLPIALALTAPSLSAAAVASSHGRRRPKRDRAKDNDGERANRTCTDHHGFDVFPR